MKNIAYNAALGLNVLLVFFLLAADRLQVPAWMQVAGRMHPLVLHFPIVILLLAAVIQLMQKGKEPYLRNMFEWLLIAAVVAAALTALAGFILSKEDGYQGSDISLHKWSGVATSLL
ncbi:MAG TPA: DUF2231 domain-containing protein, partial [Phnomibacter sp.]|nr:DUF2231 domain-containing protein [Phnomibacter sp.]